MPPTFLFDLDSLDLNAVQHNQEVIREVNPQRGDMEHLNGIIWADAPRKCILGYKDVRADEFWVPGHIPGRPLLPGVLMIECAAQVASFYTKYYPEVGRLRRIWRRRRRTLPPAGGSREKALNAGSARLRATSSYSLQHPGRR